MSQSGTGPTLWWAAQEEEEEEEEQEGDVEMADGEEE
jgi:hypothetical protein